MYYKLYGISILVFVCTLALKVWNDYTYEASKANFEKGKKKNGRYDLMIPFKSKFIKVENITLSSLKFIFLKAMIVKNKSKIFFLKIWLIIGILGLFLNDIFDSLLIYLVSNLIIIVSPIILWFSISRK